jgi:hemoglobin
MGSLMADPPLTVTTEEISLLVDTFYARVQLDAVIGPIFNREVEDWPAHLALLKQFWAAVILGTPGFKGNPMEIHLKLLLEPEHFERWLTLFAETATDVLSEPAAAMFIGKSRRIAETFQRVIASRRSGLGLIPG